MFKRHFDDFFNRWKLFLTQNQKHGKKALKFKNNN